MKFIILSICVTLFSGNLFAQDKKNFDILNYVKDSILLQKEILSPVILEKESMILDTSFCDNWDYNNRVYSKFGNNFKELSDKTSNILDLSKYINCKTNLIITNRFSKDYQAKLQMEGYFRFLRISTPLFSTDGKLCLIEIDGDGRFLFVLEKENLKWHKKMLLRAQVW